MGCFRIVALSLYSVVILAGIIISKQVYDYDIWFHLKYGQHFVHNLTWSIDHSAFSWTATKPWTYVTWIGSSFLYIVYLLFSFQGVFALPPIVLVCTLLTYIFFLRSIEANVNLTSLSLFFLIALFFYTPIVKPAIFSILFFSICLTIYFASRNSNKHWYWWYPLVFFIWANTHGGFIFGLFFLCLALACDCLTAFAMRSSKNIDRKYFIGFAASLFLSLTTISINPYGFDYLPGIARDLISSDSVNPSKHISEYMNLWYTLDPMKDIPMMIDVSWSVICFFLLFLLLNLILLKKRYPIDIPLIISLSLFFIFAMFYVRLVQYFALVLLFSTTYLLQEATAFLPSKKKSFVIVGLMLYFCTWGGYTYVTFSAPTISFPPEVEMIYPVRASKFIDEHQLPAQLINNYTLGGYIMWANYPKYKVFADPRYWPYRKDVMEDCFSLENSKTEAEVKTILDKYPEAQTIFLQLGFLKPITVLAHMETWRLIYFDHAAVIFVRSSSPSSAIRPDFNAMRFINIHSSRVFMQLFQLYWSLKDYENSGLIRKLYDSNVSRSHPGRIYDLKFMDLQLGSTK
jgi:hypothetical protein